ncbi:MAG TPA: amidohydrolase family protein [Stellaceae bacterium]|nr:amidohydrolase family protein [Stellaceae bacterium]
MTDLAIVDTHAHIIDPARFPFAEGPGYKPTAEETGTREMFAAVLDAHGVRHALLVQLSGYGYDNAGILDAVKRYPQKFKAIAVVDPESSDRALEDFSARGVVGVRFNLASYRADALRGPGAERFLARIKGLGWYAQVFGSDAQWAEAVPVLRRSGVRVLVDHFGVNEPARGLDQPGFQAVLGLGREGRAAVKLSAPFRVASAATGFAELRPFAEAVIAAFGIENCIWGSDWPFVNVPGGFEYGAALGALDRWLANAEERAQVLARNPARLFGFGKEIAHGTARR